MNSHGVVSHDAGREPWKASSFGSSRQGRKRLNSKEILSNVRMGRALYRWKAKDKSFPTS